MKQYSSGFSLIELMIVVAVIGILATIAMPQWNQYQLKAARAQAKSALQDIAQKQERYFTNRNTYIVIAATPAVAPVGFQNFSGSDLASRKYDVTVEAGTTGSITTSFLISAVPANGFADSGCGTLTYNSAGLKTPANCW